ncbi:uncharacterized protein [Parasteatoda tepidariorum]|uniref:uncharacterized protein isoform X2 n=1 Tax=Parasteatoda tepidariorum TaxID=114398 RepID=UPI00077FD56A|nr:uncharacterized protein LOC107439618 isoform X2 [Parasteatoda tepidariorum]
MCSVVITSSGESCQSSSSASDIASEPSSPSRPITPQSMPPVPTQHCPYECLRADSEDSGLGPSPAKSLVNPTSPEGSISPIQFGRCEDEEEDDRSDSLLDLSPRTDNSYESEEKGYVSNSPEAALHEDDHFEHFCLPLAGKPAIPQSPKLPNGSSFQFLLSSSNNCVNSNNQTRTDGFCVLNCHEEVTPPQFPSIEVDDHSVDNDNNTSSFFGEQACRDEDSFQMPFTKAECIKSNNGLNLTEEDHHFVQKAHLNPKVVLIRSDFSGYTEESNSHSEDNSRSVCHELNSDCTSSNCSQVGSVDQQSVSGASPVDDGECKWLNCTWSSADANTAIDILDHIRECHVQNQLEENNTFTCLWIGCKVFERTSCSRSWLDRHILLHGGSKPFRCIVDGCNQRFGSEVVLQRHVNSHFPQSRSNKGNDSSRLYRKRRHKHRKRPQFHKCKDFIDDATMEHLRHNLFQLSSIEGMGTGGPPSAITFHSTIIGRRMGESGKMFYLLRWDPRDILPDSWVSEAEIPSNTEKVIPFSRLPPELLQLSSLEALNKSGILPKPGKRKRK